MHVQGASIAWTQKEIRLSMTDRSDPRSAPDLYGVGSLGEECWRLDSTESIAKNGFHPIRGAEVLYIVPKASPLARGMVELIGFEPTTSGLQSPRSPS